jgi:hypothetical protein
MSGRFSAGLRIERGLSAFIRLRRSPVPGLDDEKTGLPGGVRIRVGTGCEAEIGGEEKPAPPGCG